MGVTTDKVQTGANTAGADREVATRALNRELQDKGFLLTTSTGRGTARSTG